MYSISIDTNILLISCNFYNKIKLLIKKRFTETLVQLPLLVGSLIHNELYDRLQITPFSILLFCLDLTKFYFIKTDIIEKFSRALLRHSAFIV